jgi:hypothetical protein
MLQMQEVVRISDRYIDQTSPDCIDHQQRLISCMALVSVFYLMLSIFFVTMSGLERIPHIKKAHPVEFELMIMPKEQAAVPQVPPSRSLVDGKSDVGGRTPARPAQTMVVQPALRPDHRESALMIRPSNRPRIREEAPASIVSTNGVATKPQPILVEPQQASQPAASNIETNTQIGGDENDNQSAIGPGGLGNGSNLGAGNGNQQGLAGGLAVAPVVNVPAGVALGNIAPYRNRLLTKLKEVWQPTKKGETVIVSIVIGSGGELIDSEIVKTGGRKADQNALKAILDIQYEELPAWYKADTMNFQITLEGN